MDVQLYCFTRQNVLRDSFEQGRADVAGASSYENSHGFLLIDSESGGREHTTSIEECSYMQRSSNWVKTPIRWCAFAKLIRIEIESPAVRNLTLGFEVQLSGDVLMINNDQLAMFSATDGVSSVPFIGELVVTKVTI